MGRDFLKLSKEKTLELISLYKCNPCLWDHQHVHNTNFVWKNQVREQIGKELDLSPMEIRKKLATLRANWVKEYKKFTLSEHYEIKWPYYDNLKFLEGQYECIRNNTTYTTSSESSSLQGKGQRAKRKINYAMWDENSENECDLPTTKNEVTLKQSQNEEKYEEDECQYVEQPEQETNVIKRNDNEKRKLDMKYIMSELEELEDNDYYEIHYSILSDIIGMKKRNRR